jgi:hypothetical protein
MDSRLLSPSKSPSFPSASNPLDLVIPVSEIQQSKQFKESIIYNLTQKLTSLDFLKENYRQKLDKV